jgi:hypothetical protein
MEAPILIPPNWELEFHFHINASMLVVGTLLTHNIKMKNDKLVVYAYRLIK